MMTGWTDEGDHSSRAPSNGTRDRDASRAVVDRRSSRRVDMTSGLGSAESTEIPAQLTN